MLRFCLRLSVGLCSLFCLLISAILFITYQLRFTDDIYTFFTASENCEHVPCFLGIIPAETETQMMYEIINNTSMIEDYRAIQVEFGVRQLYWQWSGTQPSYITGEGFIVFIGGQADLIRIHTDLTVGEMLLSFGEPESVLTTPFDMYLHYPNYGLSIRALPNCDAVWLSPTDIQIHENPRMIADIVSVHDALTQYCAR